MLQARGRARRRGGAPRRREQGRAARPARARACVEGRPRILERLVELLSERSLHVGYVFVFGVLVLCGFGLPMPEDVVLVTGGVLAWLASPADAVTWATLLEDGGLHAMVACGLAGILVGDSVIFFTGRRLGVRVAEFRLLRRLVPPEKMEEVEKLLRRRGKLVVMIARFLPGLRAPTYFTVGHARLPFWQFLLFDGMAALVSAPLWVCLGFWLGDDIQRLAVTASRFSHYILAAVLVVIGFVALRWWRRRSSLAAAERAADEAAAAEPPER